MGESGGWRQTVDDLLPPYFSGFILGSFSITPTDSVEVAQDISSLAELKLERRKSKEKHVREKTGFQDEGSNWRRDVL